MRYKHVQIIKRLSKTKVPRTGLRTTLPPFTSMEVGGGSGDCDDADPPPSEWGLDPLFWAHVKLAVCEVVGDDAVLHPAEGTNGAVHFYRGRPTRKCEIMGYVVTLNVRDTKTIFTGASRAGERRGERWGRGLPK